MFFANWAAGTFGGVLPADALANWGISHLSVRQGEAFRLLTGTYLSHDLGMLIRQFVFAATIIGAYEWLEGTWRAITMYVVIDVIGTLIVLFVILPLLVGPIGLLGPETLKAHDVGMSAGGFGLIGALLARGPRGILGLLAVSVAIAIKTWVSFDPIADTAHLLCLLIGFGLQQAIIARRGH